MLLAEIRTHCLAKKHVTESLPFDEYTPVFKVYGKIFLLMSLDYPVSINLKCDPERAISLRETYNEITPGYHMNKNHWNTLQLEGNLRNNLIIELIDHSYDLVVKSLPKKH